jgi:fructose/tagatose bisphosphate aldolase
LKRLAAIHDRTAVPLVIHGGTGFPPEAIPTAIRHGVAKFNVGTILKKTFLAAIREPLLSIEDTANVHDVLGSHREQDYLIAGKRAMQAKVQELLQLYGSSGRARGM